VKRLRPGELLSGLSALALIGFLFLDWFGAVGGVYFSRGVGRPASAGVFATYGESGWQALGWLALALCVLAILAGLALPLVAARNDSPVLPVLGSIGTTLAGIFAMAALLVQVIAQPGPDELVDVKSGWWLGLISTFGIAVGGWMAMKEEYSPNARVQPVEVRPAPPVA
jgi:hypothetical protein